MAKKASKKSVNLALILICSLIVSFFGMVALSSNGILPFKFVTFSQINEWFGISHDTSGFKAHFIDVGQADCEMVMSDGKVLLIDSGTKEAGNKVVQYLKNHGIKKIDYFVVTHGHADHMGGAVDVMNNFEIDMLIMSDVPEDLMPTNKGYTEFLKTIGEKGLKITIAKVGTKYDLGGASFKILAPIGEYNDLNDMSIVLKVTYGNRHILFTGDAQSASEMDMLHDESDIKADILKVGHHGSETSTTIAFLNRVDPKYAVIEVGAKNTYNHPNKRVVDRILDKQIELYKTSTDGDIVFSIENDNISVKKGG